MFSFSWGTTTNEPASSLTADQAALAAKTKADAEAESRERKMDALALINNYDPSQPLSATDSSIRLLPPLANPATIGLSSDESHLGDWHDLGAEDQDIDDDEHKIATDEWRVVVVVDDVPADHVEPDPEQERQDALLQNAATVVAEQPLLAAQQSLQDEKDQKQQPSPPTYSSLPDTNSSSVLFSIQALNINARPPEMIDSEEDAQTKSVTGLFSRPPARALANSQVTAPNPASGIYKPSGTSSVINWSRLWQPCFRSLFPAPEPGLALNNNRQTPSPEMEDQTLDEITTMAMMGYGGMYS